MYCKEPETQGEDKSVKSERRNICFNFQLSTPDGLAGLGPTNDQNAVGRRLQVCGGSILPYTLESRDKRAHIYSQSTKSRHWHTSNMCCGLRRTDRWEKSKVTKEMEARGFFKHAGLHALARDNNRTRPPSMAARLA